jgi:hypothetical protein
VWSEHLHETWKEEQGLEPLVRHKPAPHYKQVSCGLMGFFLAAEHSLVGAAGRLKLSARILADDAAENCQRNCDERPDQDNNDNRAERQCRRRLQHKIVTSDSVVSRIAKNGLLTAAHQRHPRYSSQQTNKYWLGLGEYN